MPLYMGTICFLRKAPLKKGFQSRGVSRKAPGYLSHNQVPSQPCCTADFYGCKHFWERSHIITISIKRARNAIPEPSGNRIFGDILDILHVIPKVIYSLLEIILRKWDFCSNKYKIKNEGGQILMNFYIGFRDGVC